MILWANFSILHILLEFFRWRIFCCNNLEILSRGWNHLIFFYSHELKELDNCKRFSHYCHLVEFKSILLFNQHYSFLSTSITLAISVKMLSKMKLNLATFTGIFTLSVTITGYNRNFCTKHFWMFKLQLLITEGNNSLVPSTADSPKR